MHRITHIYTQNHRHTESQTHINHMHSLTHNKYLGQSWKLNKTEAQPDCDTSNMRSISKSTIAWVFCRQMIEHEQRKGNFILMAEKKWKADTTKETLFSWPRLQHFDRKHFNVKQFDWKHFQMKHFYVKHFDRKHFYLKRFYVKYFYVKQINWKHF